MSGDRWAPRAEQPRVLLVDDDERLAKSCARLLRKQCIVECVHSVDAALSVIRDGRKLDAVWSDRNMPHPSAGAEVLRAAAEAHPAALLMMVTGEPSASDDLPAGVELFHKEDGVKAIDYLLARLAER